MIWDWSAQYFIDTANPCFVPGAGARYMRGDGHRCVIGSMFECHRQSDVTFLLNYFGPVRELIELLRPYLPELASVTSEQISLLGDMQMVHDRLVHWVPNQGISESAVEIFMASADRHGLNHNYVRQS